MRKEFYNNKGELIRVEDTRTLQSESKKLLKRIKDSISRDLLKEVPQHDQNNAAMGLETNEKAQAIKSKITSWRNVYAAKKAIVEGCFTLEELDNLNRVGSPLYEGLDMDDLPSD